MPISLSSLRLRLPQRIALIFFVGVILPVAAMIWFSFFRLDAEQKNQAFHRLRQQTKSISMSIYERLMLLETEMRLVATHAAAAPDGLLTTLQRKEDIRFLPQGFDGLYRLGASGAVQPSGGAADAFALKASDLNSQSSDQAAIITRSQNGDFPQLWLAVPAGGSEWIVGQINADYLWGVGTQFNLPPDTELCVTDDAGEVLVASMADQSALVASLKRVAGAGSLVSFAWRDGKDDFMATGHNLFLSSRFANTRWTIVLAQSQKTILASVRELEFIFPLVGLLTLLVAMFLTSVAIRRNLAPLKALSASTRAIAAGDFSSRVHIGGSPEFGELADAFNRMSEQIGKQFQELSLLAAFGRQVTAIMDLEGLSAALMDSITRYLGFDRIAILLADGPRLRPTFARGSNFGPEEMEELCALFAEGPSSRGGNPAGMAFETRRPVIWEDPLGMGIIEALPSSGFLRRIRPQALVCEPIVHEEKALGVILLIDTRCRRTVTASERELLNGIATTVAVCVSGIYAYRRLRESEERFRSAFEHSAAGIALVDLEGKLLRANPYLSRMLGHSPEEMRSMTYLDITHPEDRGKSLEAVQALLSEETDATVIEQRYLRKDGRLAWGLASTSLVKDGKGGPTYFLAHIQDITAHKEALNESAKLETQLRRAQKMEAIGTLAAGIAHDFNNVLAAMMGYTEMARFETTEAAIGEHLDHALQACGRAAGLTKQILSFSRQDEEHMEPVQLSSVVKETLKLLRSTIPAHIAIVQKVSNAPIFVQADPTQIHQVIMNLCTNAYHAMLGRETGTLEVTLAPESGPGPADAPSTLRLSIADNGCGMSPEVRERIFEPYFTTKQKGLGTGLGLSIVHGIVRKHKADIRVQSEPGMGTVFEIRFPVIEHAPGVSPGIPSSLPRGREGILLVDDETMLTSVCTDFLSRQGYRVEARNDPLEALEEFRRNPDRYQLVITDFAMPGMNGERLAAELFKIRTDVPVLLCTGYKQESSASLPNPAIKECILKPVSLNALAEAVRRIIDGSQAQPPNRVAA